MKRQTEEKTDRTQEDANEGDYFNDSLEEGGYVGEDDMHRDFAAAQRVSAKGSEGAWRRE